MTINVPISNLIGEGVLCLFCLLLFGIVMREDFKNRRIPDALLIALTINFCLLAWKKGEGGEFWISPLILGAIGCVLKISYKLLGGQEGLGWGDVKLISVLGLCMKISEIPEFLILSGMLGIGTSILWRYLYEDRWFPFAPALIVGFMAEKIAIIFC